MYRDEQGKSVVARQDELADLKTVVTLLESLHERMDSLEQGLVLARQKETYTTEEAAERLNRQPWTVRDWCNQGQVPGAQKVHGKGRGGEWRIPHEGLVRLQNEGPVPLKKVQLNRTASR